MDFPSVAERIRDLIIHYKLLPKQHSALSDAEHLLLCMLWYTGHLAYKSWWAAASVGHQAKFWLAVRGAHESMLPHCRHIGSEFQGDIHCTICLLDTMRVQTRKETQLCAWLVVQSETFNSSQVVWIVSQPVLLGSQLLLMNSGGELIIKPLSLCQHRQQQDRWCSEPLLCDLLQKSL